VADQPFIHNQSSLALIAAFVVVLRERYSLPNDTPWVWTGDPNTASLHIYSQYDRASEASNLVPRIVINRGPLANQRIVIGDMDQNQPALMTTGAKYFHQLASCSFAVECIAETNGESDIIADVTQAAISGAEELIAKNFTLRQISPLLTQPTRPYDTDKEKWVTEIEFRVDLERRWFTLPNALTMRRYNAEINFRNDVEQLVQLFIDGKAI
jgi:hypothetical protein